MLWTYEAGDVIDSSAAIADGVVYVGGGNGDLLALDLASGKLRWKYATGNLIGESSPAVGADAVYIGDLGGIVHAVSIARRQGAVDVQDRVGDQVVAGRRRRRRAHRLVRRAPLRARRDDRASCAGRCRPKGQVHATPAVQDGLAFIAGCDAIFRAIRVADGREMYQIESGAYTGASPVVDGDRAYFGTFNNEVLALDLKRRTVALALLRSRTRSFPTTRPPRSATAA